MLLGIIYPPGLNKARIDATDKEIDRMVYEWYGLTEEEMRMVEKGYVILNLK